MWGSRRLFAVLSSLAVTMRLADNSHAGLRECRAGISGLELMLRILLLLLIIFLALCSSQGTLQCASLTDKEENEAVLDDL